MPFRRFSKSIFTVLFLVMTGCSGSGESVSQRSSASDVSPSSIPAYPAWFLQPGLPDAELTTGFAMASFYEDRAVERAAADAAKTKRAHRGLGISYTTFWEQLPDDSFRLTGEEFLTDTLSAQIPETELQDYATVGRMTISLVSTTDAITLPINKQRTQPGPQPAWIRNTPTSENYIYAIGYSPVYYYEHESWRRAEISALKSLAQDVEIRHQRLVRTLNGASEAITLQTSEIVTGQITIVERWRDRRNSYVLVRMRSQL